MTPKMVSLKIDKIYTVYKYCIVYKIIINLIKTNLVIFMEHTMMGQEDMGVHILGRGISFEFRCDYPLDDVTIQTIYATKGYSSKNYHFS